MTQALFLPKGIKRDLKILKENFKIKSIGQHHLKTSIHEFNDIVGKMSSKLTLSGEFIHGFQDEVD